MKNRLLHIIPVFFLVVGSPLLSSAKTVTRASYWINRLDNPDAVVLTSLEIGALNRTILEKTDQMADIASLPPAVSHEQLIEYLLYDPIPDVTRFDLHGKRIKKEFFAKLYRNMNLGEVRESNEVKFAVVVRRADIRAFPTDEPVLKWPGSLEFDTVQYSSVYPPERVALLHTSRDGRWGFFQTGTVRGWMRLDNVAFEEREKADVAAGKPLVVTGSHVNVYSDRKLEKLLARLPMGDALQLRREKGVSSPWVVKFPEKAGDSLKWVNGYVDAHADARVGFLPYTKRNVLTQAFKMLGEKYGWGGKNGRRDCSEFVKDIFASMGIKLPRNSHEQSSVGVILAKKAGSGSGTEIAGALKEAEPGITLLGLDRHIMLYIGSKNGEPYVIHQFVGYRTGKRFRMVNRVAVTSLSPGGRSKRGSFKSRIRSVIEVIVPAGAKAPDQNRPA